jgi:hypothetical protein
MGFARTVANAPIKIDAMICLVSFMPTGADSLVYTSSPTDQSRKRWTRSKVRALENSGLLADQHLDLISGELLNKMGKNRPDVNATTRIRLWTEGVFGAEFVACEAPIDVAPGDKLLS